MRGQMGGILVSALEKPAPRMSRKTAARRVITALNYIADCHALSSELMRRLHSAAAALTLLSAFAIPLAGAQNGLAGKSRAANQALLAGDYGKAVSLFRELVAVLPDNAGLRLNLGLALEKAGQPSAAIPELEHVVHIQPQSSPAWFLLGLAYQQLKQPRKSIAPLRKAVLLDKSNFQALLELADAELAAGDPRNAVEEFQKLALSHPDIAKAWEGLGLSYVAMGERFFSDLERSALGLAYWRALLARSRAGDGQYGEALDLYEEAIRELPSVPGLHAARAEIYRETKHADWAAVEEERESRVAKPDCASQPAACAYLAGEWAKALNAGRQTAPPQTLYWAALAAGKLAEQSLGRLAQMPPSPEVHELLAESYQRMGRRLEAVEEWRRALAILPDDRRVRARLAESLVRNREYEEAERLLEPLVKAAPEDGELRYLLGNALFEQRRSEDALVHLIASVRLLPDYLPAREVLGRAYIALGQPEKAIQHLERALPLDDGAISFVLSAAYRRLGREDDARAAFTRYQKLTHKNSAPRTEISPP